MGLTPPGAIRTAEYTKEKGSGPEFLRILYVFFNFRAGRFPNFQKTILTMAPLEPCPFGSLGP